MIHLEIVCSCICKNKMQFDYDQEMTTSNDFESDVLQRLQRIENLLTSLSAQNDLVQELIRKEMRSSPMVEKEQKPLSFTIVTVQNPTVSRFVSE